MKILSLIVPNYRRYTIRYIASLGLLCSIAALIATGASRLIDPSMTNLWVFFGLQIAAQIGVIWLLKTQIVTIYTGLPDKQKNPKQ